MLMDYVVGIDEVGRGSLAGPVTVVAVAVFRGAKIANPKIGQLRDSKKLSPKQREEWFSYFDSHPKIRYAVARVYPRNIEKMNISSAANLAALRAFTRLSLNGHKRVFLDGGLFLGRKGLVPGTRTIPKGDEKIPAIKIASIIAKVSRDRAMVRLGKKYPKYDLATHKGYGTRAHFAALRKYGASRIHRLTFLPKHIKI